MADRSFQQFQGSLDKGLVKLFCTVSVAGGGAVTLKSWNPSTRAYGNAPTSGSGYAKGAQGISSVARTGTGAWTITLQDKYQRLVGCSLMQVTSSGAMTVVGVAVDSATDVTASTPVVKVVFSSAATTAADPANGDQITLELTLQNLSTR